VQIELGDAPRYDPPKTIAKCVKRERKLLEANEKRWLGPLEPLNDLEQLEVTFRRGFVSRLWAGADLLAEQADAVAEHCPVLNEAEVLGVRGCGYPFRTARWLAPVRTLRLEGWPWPADAKDIAASPYLKNVEHLSAWLGSRNDREVCKALAGSKHLPALKRFELIQLRGGMLAGDEVHSLATHADQMAKLVNKTRGEPVAVVSRPFAAKFPLAPYVCNNMYGGLLPTGQQVLARYVELDRREPNDADSNWEFFYFDDDGRLTGAERRALAGDWPKKRPKLPFTYKPWSSSHKIIVEWLWREMQIRPATIHVREFEAATFLSGHELSVYKFGRGAFDVFENPDAGEFHDDMVETSREVRDWLRSSRFVMTPYGSEYWGDASGTIIAT
jgi:hypothetical protein